MMAFCRLSALLVCVVATAADDKEGKQVVDMHYPVCVKEYGTNENISKACKKYCDDATIGGVATSFGSVNQGLRLTALVENAEGKGLCDSAQSITCAEPVLHKIETIFDDLRGKGGLVDNIASLQDKIQQQVQTVENKFKPTFLKLMDDFPNLDETKGEPMQESRLAVDDFEKGYVAETEDNLDNLSQFVDKLEKTVKSKMQALNEHVKTLGNQVTSCNTMINTKPPKVMCRIAKGKDEYNHCCCRSNGLTTMGTKPNSGKKVASMGKSMAESMAESMAGGWAAAKEVAQSAMRRGLENQGATEVRTEM